METHRSVFTEKKMQLRCLVEFLVKFLPFLKTPTLIKQNRADLITQSYDLVSNVQTNFLYNQFHFSFLWVPIKEGLIKFPSSIRSLKKKSWRPSWATFAIIFGSITVKATRNNTHEKRIDLRLLFSSTAYYKIKQTKKWKICTFIRCMVAWILYRTWYLRAFLFQFRFIR